MSTFFIPAPWAPATKEDAEQVHQAIVKFAGESLGWVVQPAKIEAINYRHEHKEFYAKVGEVEPRTQEPVIAILRSNCYLVCTPNRGFLRGDPILVGIDEVYGRVDFEPLDVHRP